MRWTAWAEDFVRKHVYPSNPSSVQLGRYLVGFAQKVDTAATPVVAGVDPVVYRHRLIELTDQIRELGPDETSADRDTVEFWSIAARQ